MAANSMGYNLGEVLASQGVLNPTIRPDQPAILLYAWCLQSRRDDNLSEDELHTVQDCLHLLTSQMTEEARELYFEECSRLRRRDALMDKALADPRD